MKGITLHIFSNGRGFFDLGADMTSAQAELFRQWWIEEGRHEKSPEKLIFGGTTITVVEHPMPFGEVEVRG